MEKELKYAYCKLNDAFANKWGQINGDRHYLIHNTDIEELKKRVF